MPFSEAVKIEAKRRAHYKCVLCRQPIFLEVHHIIPQQEGGSDELDNAVPLCPSCHDLWGANPEKRKFIREIRDWFWEFCAKQEEQPSLRPILERVDQLHSQLGAVAETQQGQQRILEEIKGMYADHLSTAAAEVSSARTVQEFLIASGTPTTIQPQPVIVSFEVPAPTVTNAFRCMECGFKYDTVANSRCPRCGGWPGGPKRSA